MKYKITKEYIRRIKILCKSKLNEGNLINGLNTWTVGVVPYSAGIVDWIKEELLNIVRKTTKIMAINGCMHARSNVARLHLSGR